MSKDLIIEIPIGDWQDEYLEIEADVSTEPAIVEAQREHNLHPAKLARLVITARERGDTVENILPTNKALLNTGGATEISRQFASKKCTITTPSGKEFEARAFIAKVEEGDDFGFVDIEDRRAFQRAELYLKSKVPGYIWGRLVIIASHGGDLHNMANWLKSEIDAMIGRLT